MSSSDPEYFQTLSSEERYDLFLSMVAEEREIWILLNGNEEFLKIYSQDHDIEYLPVWPSADSTEAYNNDTTEKLCPKSISLPHFLAKWVAGLKNDNLKVGVFPNAGEEVWIMEPEELKSDIQDEISNSGF